MTSVFIVNEITLWRLVVLSWLRRDVLIIDVEPLFPPVRRFLESVVRWALEGDRARRLIDLYPDLLPDWENPDEGLRHDTFRKIEPWQNQSFRFADFPDADPYGRAYRHVVGKYLWWKYRYIFPLAALGREWRPGSYRLFGLSDDTVGLLEAYYGGRGALAVEPQRIWSRPINLLVTGLIAIYAIGWIMSRVRPGAKAQEVFFAADYHGDWRDRHLYDELLDVKPHLYVPRVKPIPEAWKKGLEGALVCLPDEGCFPIGSALGTMAMVVADGLALFRAHGGRNPRLFYDIATLPYRRALLRGLFNRYRPRYFWGRDDYQVEHILRRQELNRVGGKSYGISHAVQGICIVLAAWRYINFDTYYVFGKRLPEYFKDTWPPDMTVRPVGTFGFSRTQLTRPRNPARNILFMLRYRIDNPEYVRMIRAVAEAFPDYTVLLQVKKGYPHDRHIPALVEAARKDRPNVVHTNESVYQLVLEAAYALSDASTIVAEAIQVGVPTLMLDIIPEHETCVFREFPGLCLTSAEDLVAALRDLLAGNKTYPRDAYRDLVEMSDTVIYDVIREDMDLAPRQAA